MPTISYHVFSDCRSRPFGEDGRGSDFRALSALGRISGGPDRPFSWPHGQSVALSLVQLGLSLASRRHVV